MNTEPVAFTALIVTVVNAVLALVIAFGVDVTTEQAAAILGVANAVLAFGGAVYARHKVSPVARAEP